MKIFFIFAISINLVNGQNTPCGANQTEREGFIHYMVYPGRESSIDCTWRFLGMNIGDSIQFSLIGRFDMREGARLSLMELDGYQVQDKEIGYFKDYRPHQKSILLQGNYENMALRFYSRRGGIKDVVYGFVISFRIHPKQKCSTSSKFQSYLSGSLHVRNLCSENSWIIAPYMSNRKDKYIVMFFTGDLDSCSGNEHYILESKGNDLFDHEKNISCKFGATELPKPIYTLGESIQVRLEKPQNKLPNLLMHYSTLYFKNYQEICDEINLDLCNPRKLLKCHKGECKCLYPDQMEFNEMKDMCVSKPKGKCIFPLDELKGNINSSLCMAENLDPDNLGNPSIFCNSDGICGCSKGYFEAPLYSSDDDYWEFCILGKKFGEICSGQNQCLSPLICTSKGRCGCDSGAGHADSIEGHCVGDVQGPCLSSRFLCVNGTECNKEKMICECSGGTMESLDNRKCQGGHGQACSLTAPCSDRFFHCIDSKCECRNPTRSTYDPERKRCTSKVYGECSDDLDCSENMKCGVKKGSFFKGKQCLCAQGFKSDGEGACKPEFGSNCHEGECDISSNIFCVNGKCNCHDALYRYSKNLEKCFGIVGAPCSRDEECHDDLVCKRDGGDFILGRCELTMQASKGSRMYFGINCIILFKIFTIFMSVL